MIDQRFAKATIIRQAIKYLFHISHIVGTEHDCITDTKSISCVFIEVTGKPTKISLLLIRETPKIIDIIRSFYFIVILSKICVKLISILELKTT